MRRLAPALTLTLAATLALWPGGGGSQEVSPDLAERLRAAVENRADDATLADELAQAPQLEPAELDDLVAPVALYPDALLAQVLAAATYLDQIARAGEIVAAGDEMSDAELERAIAEEDWDPSVLALLSGFPTVIARMAEDLDWTTRLGAAMLRQDDGVLAAVQRMRLEAEAAGNLVSNAAQTVEREGETIAIRPAKPEVVYVPDYDPAVVYSTRNAPAYVPPAPAPGLPVPEMLVSGALGFGAGFLVNELLQDDDKGGGNGGKGWKDYWRQDRPIDWRDRRFYPRPQRDRDWRADRDRYWDPYSGRWRRDDDLRRRDADERRRLAPWIVPAEARDPGRSDREFRAWRERARQEAREEARREARQERREEERRDARQERRAEERRDARQDRRAEERRAEERRAAAEAREGAEKAQAQERRAAERKADERRAEERRADERRAEARKTEAVKAEARKDSERRAERAEERRKAARAEERRKAEQRKEARPVAVRQKPDAARAEPERKAKAGDRKAGDQGERRKSQAQPRREEPQRKAAKKCGPDDNRKACRSG